MNMNMLSPTSLYGIFFRHILIHFLRPLFKHFPLDNRQIIFCNFVGKGYGENPKYIAEKMHELYPEYTLFWLVDNHLFNKERFPNYIHPVKLSSVRGIYTWATSKVIVTNIRNIHLMRKKTGQIYLQTWHGAFAIKAVEADAKKTLSKRYIKEARYDGFITDGILAGNKVQKESFQRAFWLSPDTEILEFGIPRNDVFVLAKKDNSIQRAAKKRLGFVDDVYYILYAPTFRDDNSLGGYQLKFEELSAVFEKKIGKRCVFIVRLHPNVDWRAVNINYYESIINGNAVADIQDLSLAADCLISDYSSVIFDFLLQEKPVFICALDLEEYEKIRPVKQHLVQLPVSFAVSSDELYDNITRFRTEEYQEKLRDFFRDYSVYDVGAAAEKTAYWIVNRIRNT